MLNREMRVISVSLGVAVLSALFAPPVCGAATAPPDQDATAADIANARSLSKVFQSVAKKIEPAVVHITQLRRVPSYRRDIFGFPRAVGESSLQPTGLGSGVLVSEDGYILTNNHVVKESDGLLVRLTTRDEYEAKVVGRDDVTDLAVIKIDAKGLKFADFADSDQLEVGEWVIAIGSPFGFSSSVTSGIVSAKGRSGIAGLQGFQDFIQTDAAINPGNSGGPLLNLDGQIIGINSAIATRTGGYEGIGFAIPSNVARSTMDSIIKTGRVARGWLGVELGDDASEGAAKRHDGSVGEVRVTKVVENSPASKAGLKAGDVIVSFRGRAVGDVSRLRTAIAVSAPDSTIPIEVRREGKKLVLNAKVGDASTSLADAFGGLAVPDAGLVLQTLSPDAVKKMGYRNVAGAVVLGVDPGSRAAAAELQVNDIIVGVDDRRTPSAEAIAQALQGVDFASGVRLSVIRGTLRGSVTLQD